MMALEEGSSLTIVVDTNVIVAALIQRGIVPALAQDHPGALATPESCIADVWDNHDDWNRNRVPEVVLRPAL